ncbi:MAG TPA: biopolymer transporter ExbD [Candidatus Eisenbacteria bacterium]|nr:biopolymer transporter ExbD [Candidatus Eisenbacteria bacterium]
MKLRRRVRHTPNIPTASMADIAMLLLIFFMSTTFIRSREAFDIRLPGVTEGDRFRRENSVRVWLGPSGEAAVNDARIPLDGIAGLLAAKLRENPRLVIALHADARAPFSAVERVFEQLKAARAPRVALAGTKRGRP